MSTDTLDKLVWVLIYGGLLVLCLGLFPPLRGGAFGWALVVGGAVAAALGGMLVWVRSRRR